jgi:hypothetical protein
MKKAATATPVRGRKGVLNRQGLKRAGKNPPPTLPLPLPLPRTGEKMKTEEDSEEAIFKRREGSFRDRSSLCQ